MTGMAKPLILIVDDVPTNIQILAEALKSDYRIRIASRGVDALRLAQLEPQPDLVLLDVMMPEMDGYEVCRRLKDNPETQGIPVVFVTACDDEADEERGLQLGAIDYIVKPFRLPIVKARVYNHAKLKQKNDMLEKLAMIDGLTDIPNRRNFDQTLDQEWRRAVREREPLGLIMADVDLFKLFNDNYGHGAGDTCLCGVARTMQNVLSRPGDFLGRYGGEEFAVLLPNTDLEGMLQMAESLRAHVEALHLPHAYSPMGVVTISMGCAVFNPKVDGRVVPMDLVTKADEGLYRAKAGGRNQVGVGDSLSAE